MTYASVKSTTEISYSTYGLGDILVKPSELPTKCFCSGKCAERFATHRVRGIGRAHMITHQSMQDLERTKQCSRCNTSVFWSKKYSILVKEKEEGN